MTLATGMRQVVITGLRLSGLVLLLLAAFTLASIVQRALETQTASPGYRLQNFMLAGGFRALMFFIVQAAAGAFLCRYAGRLTLWLVPRITDSIAGTSGHSACLRCGHDLNAANAGTCPECGTNS